MGIEEDRATLETLLQVTVLALQNAGLEAGYSITPPRVEFPLGLLVEIGLCIWVKYDQVPTCSILLRPTTCDRTFHLEVKFSAFAARSRPQIMAVGHMHQNVAQHAARLVWDLRSHGFTVIVG
jgi:hypothetical protein